MIRPPPTPTLFPYTTLFRSLQTLQREPDLVAGEVFARDLVDEALGARGCLRVCRPGPAAGRQHLDRVRQDRKSTRLNSSHSQISYAVFCLKKKNRTHPSKQR